MSLKPILESLDGLHEEVAKLYTKKDGKFVLDVEDTGLKSALQKERDRAEAAEKALKARDEAEAAEKAKKEREDLEKKGEYEKLRAQDAEAIKKEKDRADRAEALRRNDKLSIAAMEAITAAKGIPKALLPHITPNLEVVPDGDDYKVVVKGNPAQKLTDYVASLKNDMAWGFEGSGANGGGAHQGGATSGKVMTKAEFDNLTPSARAEVATSGVTIKE